MARLILGLSLCCLMAGCAWRTQVQRGTVSTSKIDFDKCYEVDETFRISGADRAHGVWLIPLGSPDADEAIRRTIAEANAKNPSRKIVALTNTEVKFRLLWLYLYSQRWYSVEGNPIYEKK